MTYVDLRYPDMANTRWKSLRFGSTYPWAGGGGGGGSVTDPTAGAGSLPVGQASYAVPTSNVIFISPSGSDSNPGTDEATPKATLKGAMTAATNNTTIVARTGSYNDGADTQTGGTATDSRAGMVSQLGALFNTTKTNITIQNYPGEAVWFDGSVTFDTNWTHDATSGLWWHTYDRRMDRSHSQSPGAVDDGSGGSASGGYWVSNSLNANAAIPDMILRDGVELQVVGTQAAVTSGKVFIEGNALTSPHNLWFQGTKVWVADDPTGHEMRYSNKNMLLQFNTGPLTIRGVGIRRYASFQPGQGALYLQTGNVTFENVWFEHFSALVINGPSGGANRTYKNVTCRYAGFAFLGGGNADNLIIDSCDFRYNNYRNFNVGGPTAAIVKMNGTQGITVKNSNFSDSNISGFWTDRTCNNINVYNNRFQNLGNQSGGFLGAAARAVNIEGSSAAIVANNLITGIGGFGIWNNDSSASKVYNNTVVDTHRQSVDSTGKKVGGGPITIGQSNRRPWETGANFPEAGSNGYQWMRDGRQPQSYYDNPDHQYACRNWWMYNNILAVSAGGQAETLFSCQSQVDDSIANPAIGGTGDGVRGFTAFIGSGGMDGNVYWTETQLVYAYWIITNGYNNNATVHYGANQGQSLSHFQTAFPGLETNGTQRALGAAGKPINAAFQVTDSTLHTKAQALPSDIAALIGQTAGTKRAGCFFVGDPA